MRKHARKHPRLKSPPFHPDINSARTTEWLEREIVRHARAIAADPELAAWYRDTVLRIKDGLRDEALAGGRLPLLGELVLADAIERVLAKARLKARGLKDP